MTPPIPGSSDAYVSRGDWGSMYTPGREVLRKSLRGRLRLVDLSAPLKTIKFCGSKTKKIAIKDTPTPPAVGPCFRRSLVSCGYGRGQNETGLPNRNPNFPLAT